MNRPDWDTYFLSIAAGVATRVACTRRQHGAVVVKDNRIISTGYNGAPSGHVECTDGGCPRGRLEYGELASLSGGYDDPLSPGFCISVHAEANALLHAGRKAHEATIYVTGQPCHGCSKLIAASGITRIVFNGDATEAHPRDARPGGR